MITVDSLVSVAIETNRDSPKNISLMDVGIGEKIVTDIYGLNVERSNFTP